MDKLEFSCAWNSWKISQVPNVVLAILTAAWIDRLVDIDIWYLYMISWATGIYMQYVYIIVIYINVILSLSLSLSTSLTEFLWILRRSTCSDVQCAAKPCGKKKRWSCATRGGGSGDVTGATWGRWSRWWRLGTKWYSRGGPVRGLGTRYWKFSWTSHKKGA